MIVEWYIAFQNDIERRYRGHRSERKKVYPVLGRLQNSLRS